MKKPMLRFTLFLLIWLTLPLTGTAQVVDIPDPNLRAAVETELGKASGDTITVAEMATLTELDASEIGVSQLTGLETAGSLTVLWLDGNTIADISPLAGLINLSELGLWGNAITDISPLAELTNLAWLGLSDNSITNISALTALTNLTSLGLSGNPIADFSPLMELTHLTSLGLGFSDIGDISFLAGLTNLTTLGLALSGISDISPLAGLTNLTHLDLWANEITGISPLTDLTHLIDLSLDSNAITDISPLAGLTNLTSLGLDDNSISDLSPLVANTGLGAGDHVYLINNPLSDLSINTHIPTLEGRGVTVWFDASENVGTSDMDTTGMQIYWVADNGGVTPGEIHRANLDGTNVQDLVIGLDNPFNIALDVESGKMYWADGGTGKIQCANLDGSNVQDLVIGLGNPFGIALDVASGKMYWTNNITGKIQRANLNGTHIEDLVTAGLQTPFGIALDLIGGKMYWTDWSTGKIQCADLDGSNAQDLVTTGLEHPVGIALDVWGGKMYWTNFGAGKIQRANLDGTEVEDLVTGLGGTPSIALDLAGGKMYWTDYETNQFHRASLDGSNIEDLFDTGVVVATGIALATSYFDEEVNIIDPNTNTPIAQVDINQDGKVNITDLLLVVSTLGDSTPALVFADVNGDSWVTIDDVMLVIEALDDPVTAAAPAIAKELAPINTVELEAHLNRLRSQSDGSLKYQRAIDFFQNLLAAVAPPDKTELLANYPNPFNPETWIPYNLAQDADVKLTIFDTQGEVVRRFDLGHQTAGYYTDRNRAVYWDGRNNFGETVSSGVYFYHLDAGGYSQTRKMLILK